MEKENSYRRKIFHRGCMIVLVALFATLIAVLLLQDDVDEAALLHTAICAMIMLMDIVLAVGYSSGRYNTSRLQDRIYMMLLMLVSVSLLVLGVYRFAFFGPAYYYLEPFIVQVSLVLTAIWTCLFGLFDLKFFGLPEKRRARIRNVIVVLSALFVALVITNPLTELLVGEAGPEGISPGPLFPLTWAYTMGMSAWYIVMILKFMENRRTKTALLVFEVHVPIWFALDLLIGLQRSGYALFTFLETFVSFLSSLFYKAGSSAKSLPVRARGAMHHE